MSLHNQPLFVSAIRDYGPSLVNISTMFTNNETEQKALYQRMVLSIWQALEHYKQDEHEVDLCIFVYQVAFNCVYLRVTKDHKDEQADALSATETLLQDTPLILRAMRQLAFVHRQFLCLLFDEFSYEDIAMICGIDVSTVPDAVVSAQLALKQKMASIEQSGEVVNV